MKSQLNTRNTIANACLRVLMDKSPANPPFFYFCGPEIDLSESSAGPKSEKRLIENMEKHSEMRLISYKLPGRKPKLCIPPDSFVTFRLLKSEYGQLREWLSRISERGHANIEIALGKNEQVWLFTPKKTLAFYLSTRKIKIYRYLAIAGANLGQIAKETKMTYETTKNHLNDLTAASLVVERKYGKRIRFFTLNRETPMTKRILQMLDSCYEV